VDKDKLYRAELSLGTVTDTQDSYGTVVSSKVPDTDDREIQAVFERFRGKLLQLPPMYSALKVEGKKLYELARQGITIERMPREIEIFSMDILEIDRKDVVKILFDVHCSKGTYIRTLCADIGEALGCGGHMSFLLRKRSGAFDSDTSLTVEEVETLASQSRLESRLISVDKALEGFGEVILDSRKAGRLLNGVAVALEKTAAIGASGKLVKVYNEVGSFLAVGELSETSEGVRVKSKKLFV
jgi:tRNA pseudouridine55 synthase